MVNRIAMPFQLILIIVHTDQPDANPKRKENNETRISILQFKSVYFCGFREKRLLIWAKFIKKSSFALKSSSQMKLLFIYTQA